MRYKIKDIPEEGLLCAQPIGPALFGEVLSGSGGDADRSAGAVRLELTRHRDEIYVRGEITATLGLACGACLGPARAEVKVPVKMVYLPEGETPEEEEGDPSADEDVAEHDGQTIDLEPMIREQLILSLPMSARCREDCRGLCPVCGQDRNQADCGHSQKAEPEPEPEDEKRSPFAALKDVKLS